MKNIKNNFNTVLDLVIVKDSLKLSMCGYYFFVVELLVEEALSSGKRHK